MPDTRTPGPSPFISFAELLALLQLDGRTARRFIRRGKIPLPDIDLSYRVKHWKRERIEQWLTEQATAMQEVSHA